MPAASACHGLVRARSMASNAVTSAPEKINSLINVVLRNTTHGLSTSTAQSAVRMAGPNPADWNQHHASVMNAGSMTQATTIPSADFPEIGDRFSRWQPAQAAKAADIWFET